jgi:hypothetical protein
MLKIIIKNPSKYYLYMYNGNITGIMLWSKDSESESKLPPYDNVIEICEKNQKGPYDVITELFKNNNESK